MTTAYCIDVSGSVTTEMVNHAMMYVKLNWHFNDVIIAFSSEAQITSLEEIAAVYSGKQTNYNRSVFFGGTDLECVRELCKSLQPTKVVVISDGEFPPNEGFRYRFVNVTGLQFKDIMNPDQFSFQICDWMRGKALDRTGFDQDERRTGSIDDILGVARTLFQQGLNVKLTRTYRITPQGKRNPPREDDSVDVRIWVDDQGFGQR